MTTDASSSWDGERWYLGPDERVRADEVEQLLDDRLAAGQTWTALGSDRGRMIFVVTNRERVMVVLMDELGDEGTSTADPGAVGSSDGFVIDDGQVDAYDDCDTVPWEIGRRAVRTILETGHPPTTGWSTRGAHDADRC